MTSEYDSTPTNGNMKLRDSKYASTLRSSQFNSHHMKILAQLNLSINKLTKLKTFKDVNFNANRNETNEKIRKRYRKRVEEMGTQSDPQRGLVVTRYYEAKPLMANAIKLRSREASYLANKSIRILE